MVMLKWRAQTTCSPMQAEFVILSRSTELGEHKKRHNGVHGRGTHGQQRETAKYVMEREYSSTGGGTNSLKGAVFWTKTHNSDHREKGVEVADHLSLLPHSGYGDEHVQRENSQLLLQMQEGAHKPAC